MKRLLLIGLLTVLAILLRAQNIVPVFQEGQEGYAGYRIPAIIKAADGSLIAFAEARKNGKGDTGNIDLVMRKSLDNGMTWGAMKVIWDDGNNTCGNPAPVLVGNKIILLATWNLGKDKEQEIERNCSEDTRRVYLIESEDDGDTWTEPMEISSMIKSTNWGWYATGPCHAIVKQLKPNKDRIIVPCNHSEIDQNGQPASHSHLIYSDDGGKNWSLGAITKINGNESSVVELSNGRLLLNMRRSSSADTVRYYALSTDGGRTFKIEGKQNDLVEPRCQGSVINILKEDGKPSKTLVFSNPANASKRENLSLRISKDNGKSWKYLVSVYMDQSAYSDLVQLNSKRVGVLFENGDGKQTYRRISFVSIQIEK